MPSPRIEPSTATHLSFAALSSNCSAVLMPSFFTTIYFCFRYEFHVHASNIVNSKLPEEEEQ